MDEGRNHTDFGKKIAISYVELELNIGCALGEPGVPIIQGYAKNTGKLDFKVEVRNICRCAL